VVRIPTSHALKSHARSTLFGDVTASSTRLRTKSRIDESHFPSGTLSLLDNQPRNQSESRIEQCSIESGFGRNLAAGMLRRTSGTAGHVLHPQIFQRDPVVGIDDRPRHLVRVIPALASNLLVKPSDHRYRLTAILTAFAPFGNDPLAAAQAQLRPLDRPRIFDQPPIARS
jgi:hypothetical protein